LTLTSAFGSSDCDVDETCGGDCLYTECSADGLSAYARTYGYVCASDDNYSCDIYAGGSSSCSNGLSDWN